MGKESVIEKSERTKSITQPIDNSASSTIPSNLASSQTDTPNILESVIVSGTSTKIAGDLDIEQKNSLFYNEYTSTEFIKNLNFNWSAEKTDTGYLLSNAEEIHAQVKFDLRKSVKNLAIGLPIFDSTGTLIAGPDSRRHKADRTIWKPGIYEFMFTLKCLPIQPGKYWFSFSIADDPAIIYRQHCAPIIITDTQTFFGITKISSNWTITNLNS
jgi:hypothetical protein